MPEKLSPKYYQENKEWLQEKAYTRYQNLSKEEREEKPQYHCEHYKNLSEDKKSWLSIEKNIKWEKFFIIIIKKYFNL